MRISNWSLAGYDMPSRNLDDLNSQFKPSVFALLARLTEAGLCVMIVNTGRTPEEQAHAVATGHSTVAHSKHEDGLAIDICPFSQWELHGPDKLRWDTSDPVWLKIGAVGEALGLRWGGRFHSKSRPLNSIGVGWDAGHFEYATTQTPNGVPA